MKLSSESTKLLKMLEQELQRCSADVTSTRLTELYYLAMDSNGWQFVDRKEQLNLFFEISNLIVLKRHIERLIESLK